MNLERDLNNALLNSLKLKARIMAIIFGAILTVQVVMIFILYFNTSFFEFMPLQAAIVGPGLILGGCLLEIYAFKYFRDCEAVQKPVSLNFKYLVTFCEISFPTLLLVFASFFIGRAEFLQPSFLMSSPPGLIYFILIILTAFTLHPKLCLFAGIVAAIEYCAFSVFILSQFSHSQTELPNNLIKGVLMLVCGIVTGLVSKKIKEAVFSSLKSKNDLIFKLDALVTEKTAEIQKQKEELHEKHKDITDSINYARKIQNALLPGEKYIARQMNRLNKDAQAPDS